MTPEYKAEKEASVSFLGGGGIWEINNVTLVAPAAALLWSILQSRQGYFKSYTLPAYVTDFLLQCCAILFAVTVYSGSPQALNGLLILPAIAAVLQPSGKASPSPSNAKEPSSTSEPNGKLNEKKDQAADDDLSPLPVKPFITTYRGAMMIITCITILAVDFPVFPRRFAKTEAFGTSLMDLGVGSFVFAAGIVAARQQLKDQQAKASSFASRIKTAMRHSAPLFALGFIRLWSVKGLEYVEHVSEYGVHWNFFFTLALLPLAVALLQPVLRFIPMYGLLAFAIGICYESTLYMVPDLKSYIILSERKQGDWMSQNREGVFSFIGYLAIFLGGMGAGMNILPRDPTELPKSTMEQKQDLLDEDADWLAAVLEPGVEHAPVSNEPPPLGRPEMPENTLGRLAVLTGFWFVACVWAMWTYGPHLFVSRRMANLAYICWVCAFNNGQLLLFCGIEKVLFPNLYKATDKVNERRRTQEATSKVMQAFNRNGLALFLLANLLTGAVNMAVETLHMGDVQAMSILVGYIGVVAGTGLLLDHYDISVKL